MSTKRISLGGVDMKKPDDIIMAVRHRPMKKKRRAFIDAGISDVAKAIAMRRAAETGAETCANNCFKLVLAEAFALTEDKLESTEIAEKIADKIEDMLGEEIGKVFPLTETNRLETGSKPLH